MAEIEAALLQMTSADDHEPLMAAARTEASAHRQEVTELRAEVAGLERERRLRSERLAAARAEGQRWATRKESAERQIATLEARLSASKQEITQLQQNLEAVRTESLNDPLTSLANRKFFFKIDLYEDPDVKGADGQPAVTRVLTIMLVEEW